MPDERHIPGTGRRARRRSMDADGGISVSDMVARHTGERPVFNPDSPPPAPPAGRTRRPQPEAPQPNGTRPEGTEQRRQPPAARTAPPPASPRQPRPTRTPPVPPAEPEAPVARQPRPPRPRRSTTASPGPEAPTQRRPPVASPGAQPPPAAPPRPRRPGRPPQRPTAAAAVPVVAPGAVPPKTAPAPTRAEMTDEMEAIDEATLSRRKIDHTLARFSAAHDEMNAEEAKRRERRERLAARPAALLEQTRTALQRVVTNSEAEAAAEADSSPQTRLQEKKQRRIQRAVKAGRITAVVVAALVFLGTGTVWGAKTWFNAKFTTVAALDENSGDIQNAAAQNGTENFLMVGSDSRDGASDEEGVGTADSTPGARSDTIMIAHIPKDRSRVVMVSFPRDLEINRPDCQRWDPAAAKYTDQVSPAQKIAKLNTAYAVGGPQCVTKVIQQITGLRMNHFVGIDFNGFKEMVDAVRGVTVHTDIPIDDSVLGKVIAETGDVKISGDQALNFVRARHVKGDPTSDYGRIKRQQTFIGALLKTVMSKDVMLDTGKLSDFVTAFAKATFGENLGVDQMLTLAQSMRGVDPSKINFMTVPTTGTANTRGNEVLVQSKAKSLFGALIENTPLPDPNAPAANAPSTDTPPTNTSKSTTKSSPKTSTKKASTSG